MPKESSREKILALFRVVIVWCLHEAVRSLASGTSCFLKTFFYMVHLKMYFLEKLSWFLFLLLVLLLPDHLTLVFTPPLSLQDSDLLGWRVMLQKAQDVLEKVPQRNWVHKTQSRQWEHGNNLNT